MACRGFRERIIHPYLFFKALQNNLKKKVCQFCFAMDCNYVLHLDNEMSEACIVVFMCCVSVCM